MRHHGRRLIADVNSAEILTIATSHELPRVVVSGRSRDDSGLLRDGAHSPLANGR